MRLTRAEIDLKLLCNNLDGIRKHVGRDVKVMGIVKANAYGHGLVGVAQALVNFGIDYLGVGFLEEGIELRQNGINIPILVLGGVLGSQIREFLEYNLEITASSIEIAHHIDCDAQSIGKKARVHLKIDTGMERIGVSSENAAHFAEVVCGLKNIEVVGIYSHFATAGEGGNVFANQQLDRFNYALRKIHSLGIEIPLIHIANSGAILDLPNSYFTMVRPGIILYGIYPSKETTEVIRVHPVLTLKSNIVFIKEVAAKTSISYGQKYFTSTKTKVATLPVGYGDGYSRGLTNKVHVLIRGRRYPVVGAICMDQVMVDLGHDSDMHVGEDAILIGTDGTETISAWDLAETLGTVPYEVLTNMAARVPRIFIHQRQENE